MTMDSPAERPPLSAAPNWHWLFDGSNTEFVLIDPGEGHRTCRFCGHECEFYTVGHAADGTAHGHEPVPFTTAGAAGLPDQRTSISETEARQHADWALARGLTVFPDVLIALGYATYEYAELFANEEEFPLVMARSRCVFTAAGAAIAGKQPGELAFS